MINDRVSTCVASPNRQAIVRAAATDGRAETILNSGILSNGLLATSLKQRQEQQLQDDEAGCFFFVQPARRRVRW